MCFLEKGYCKALCDSVSLSSSFRTALAPDLPAPNTTKKSLTCANQPCRKEVKSTHHQSAVSSFLPLLPISLQKRKKKNIPLLSHPLLVIFEARPSLLVLHACINKLTTDFRRSRPPPIIHSSFYLIFFSLLSSAQPQNKPMAYALSVIIDVFCTTHSQLMRGSIFTPLRMSIESAILTMMPQPSLSTRTSFMQLI